MVGVGGVVIEGGKALLIRRGSEPLLGECGEKDDGTIDLLIDDTTAGNQQIIRSRGRRLGRCCCGLGRC